MEFPDPERPARIERKSPPLYPSERLPHVASQRNPAPDVTASSPHRGGGGKLEYESLGKVPRRLGQGSLVGKVQRLPLYLLTNDDDNIITLMQ